MPLVPHIGPQPVPLSFTVGAFQYNSTPVILMGTSDPTAVVGSYLPATAIFGSNPGQSDDATPSFRIVSAVLSGHVATEEAAMSVILNAAWDDGGLQTHTLVNKLVTTADQCFAAISASVPSARFSSAKPLTLYLTRTNGGSVFVLDGVNATVWIQLLDQ